MNLPGARRRSTTSRKESAAAQSDTRERKEIENYAKRNSTVFITRDYTTIKLTRLSNFYINTAATRHTSQTQKNALRSVQSFLPLSHPADPTLNKAQSEAQKTAPLPVRSSIATTPCRSAARQMLDIYSDLQTHIIRQARIEVTAAYALNHLKLQVLKPSELLQDFIYLRQDPRNITENQNKFQFLSANIMALIGTVLYNAIKEYHDDGTRKTIHFHGHTVEDNYNAIRKKSNVTVPDDHHDNDVNNILIKYTDNERQRYNTLIEDYNRAGKREDNILTIDECRTGHSNKEDIEADERESIVTDSTWDEFAMLAEEYTIDNRIIHALPEDCDALVERYEEEINCSDLYSTV
ncbi:hypothetical protein HBI86_247480 [Parastagonospora nodorum]|nr:hypothetical protein HBI86_247480 [Parastagonospora nodorum]KAH5950287.1 hypothetical protein HBI85_251330 [Parastagonospora nodorum]